MKLSPLLTTALFASLSLQAQLPNFTPPTPLIGALTRGDNAEAKRLLAAGANPNEARFIGFAPIFIPIMHSNYEMFRAMIDKGADIGSTDMIASTTLMWAAATETLNPEMVEDLLKLGVDPNTTNKMGDNALTWALRRGHTPIVAALLKAGATNNGRNKKAVESALALLQKSGPQFVRVSGCASCHHQSLPQMASQLARDRGYTVNQEISKQQVSAVVAMFKAIRPAMVNATDHIPDPPISIGYALLGLYAEGYAADENTDAAAHLVAAKQRADGSFVSVPGRPPMESSDITATALGMRAIQVYGKNPEAAIAKASSWLRSAKPQTTEERTMQLMGLAWSKANASDLSAAAKMLLAEQRPDGGWAQIPTLESDAYATGQALYALHLAGQITTADAVYLRGAGFLLRTQEADGSWHVRSRSFPFQPMKDSGFPHGKDQWSSASGTSWAAMALSLPPAPVLPETSGN